jgi:hypothetical protein
LKLIVNALFATF